MASSPSSSMACSSSSLANNIKVAVKIRPLITREKEAKMTSLWTVKESTISSNDSVHDYSFDYIFDENDTTEALFEKVARPIVASTLKGINGTIFAYGQTSSGKTHTMVGNDQHPGIIVLTVREIFNEIETYTDREFLIRIGYIEIYNEKVNDLFDKKSTDIKIHEANNEVFINHREIIVSSGEEILRHFDEGNKLKRVGDTSMNERSSRSHTIFRIIIESREAGNTDSDGAVQISHLNLVDLAGSERTSQTGATGNRFKEGVAINKSLLSLGVVINKLSGTSETETSYINYRDSKLTRILQQSLGGNALSAIICTVTPAVIDETSSTLRFGLRAQAVKNTPKVNEVLSDQVMMKRLQREIARLTAQLKEEQDKKSEVLILQIRRQIVERENQFLHANTIVHKIDDKNRRKTWCPSTTKIEFQPTKIPESSPPKISQNCNFQMPPPTAMPLFDRRSAIADFEKQLSKLPDFEASGTLLEDELLPSSDDGSLEKTLSPRNSEEVIMSIKTPETFRLKKPPADSPNVLNYNSSEDLKEKIKHLENELDEMNDFKKVEFYAVERDLKESKKQINNLESEKRELMENLEEQKRSFESAQERINELELVAEKLSSMEARIKQMEFDMREASREKMEAFKERDQAKSMLSGVEYEIERNKTLSQKREKELIESLNEARDESKLEEMQTKVKEMEESLKKLEQENFLLSQSLEKANELAEKLQTDVVNLEVFRSDSEKLRMLIDTLSNNLVIKDKLNEKTKRQDLVKFVRIIKEVLFPDCDFSDLASESFADDLNPNTVSLPTIVVTNTETIVDTRLRDENQQLMNDNKKLNEIVHKTKLELKQIKSEYEELSTQLLDAIQDSDDYKTKYQKLMEVNEVNKTSLMELDIICEKINDIREFMQKFDLNVENEVEEPTDDSKNIKTLNNIVTQMIHLKENREVLENEQNKLKKELEEMKSEDLASKLQASEENYQKLLDEGESLKIECDSVKRELEDLRSKLQSSLDNFQKLLEENQILKSEREDLSNRFQVLENERDSVIIEMDQLKSEDLANKFKESQEKYQRLEEELGKVQSLYNESLGSLEIMENQRHLLVVFKEDLANKLKASQEVCQQLEEKCGGLEVELKKLAQQQEAVEIDDVPSKLQESQEKCQQLEERCEILMKEQEALESELKEMRNNDLNSKFQESQENCQRLEEELKKIQELYNETVRSLESTENGKQVHDNLNQESEKLKLEIEVIRNSLNEKNQEILKLILDNQELELKLQKMESTVDDLRDRDDINPEDSLLKVVEQPAVETEAIVQNGVPKNTLDELQEKFRNMEAELLDRTNKVKELEESMFAKEQELENEIRDLKSGLKNILNIEEENTKLKGVEKELKALRKSFEWKQRECQKNVETIEKLTEENGTLKRDLDEAFNTIKKFADKIKDHEKLMESQLNSMLTIIQKNEEKFLTIDTILERLVFLKNVKLSNDENLAIIQELREELTEIHEKLSVFQNGAMDKKLMEIEEKVAADQAVKDELTMKINELEFTIHRQITEIEVKSNDLQVQQQLKIDLETKIQELEQTIEQIQVEKSTSDNRIRELQETMESQKEDLEKVQDQLLKTIADKELVEKEVIELTKTLENIQRSLREEDAEIDVNVKWVQELKMEKSQMESEKSALETERNDLAEKVKAMEQQTMELAEKQSTEVTELSAEIVQLKAQIDSQVATINSLNNQIEELAQNFVSKSSESEKLMKNLDDCEKTIQRLQQEMNILDVENTNKESELVIYKEKVEQLEKALREKTKEYEEFRARYKRRSYDVDVKISSMELQMNNLVQQNGAIEAAKAQVEAELKKLKNDHLYVTEKQLPEMQRQNEQFQRLIKELEMKNHEGVQQENKELKEKIKTQTSENFIHIQTIAKLRASNQELNKQLEEMREMHVFKANELQKEIDMKAAQAQVKDKDKTIKFKDEKTPGSAVKSYDFLSKMRRQSIHDERRLSLWEKFTDRGTMTDPVSELCGCNEKNKKIEELDRMFKLKDCRVRHLERMAKLNPLQLELDKALKDADKESKRYAELMRDFREANNEIFALKMELKEMGAEMVAIKEKLKKRQHANQATQTDVNEPIDLDPSDVAIGKSQIEKYMNDFKILSTKYEETKRLCKIRGDKIKELKMIIDKENLSLNANQSNEVKRLEEENINLRKSLADYEKKLGEFAATKDHKNVVCQTDNLHDEFQSLKEKYDVLLKKYEQTKIVCYLRQQDLDKVNGDLKVVQEKYQIVKGLCVSRLAEIRKLKGIEKDPEPNGVDK